MPPKAAKAKKLPKEVLNDSKLEVWREGLKTGLHSSDPDAELIELFGMFKKIAGKDKICTRAEFLKSFEKKAKIEGEPVAVKDVETLFNVSAIDYDYNTVSLHEFMMLMITIRGGNPQLKLQWIFKMYDKDESGYLSPDEVENLLLSLLTAETNEENRKQMVKDAMKRFDRNGDKRFTVDELHAALTDLDWMQQYVAKGKKVTTNDVENSAFSGKSTFCLVM